MTDNEKRAYIGNVLDRYVKWSNKKATDGICVDPFRYQQFCAWLDYNDPKAVELFGYDLLYKNLNLCVSSCAPDNDDLSAWID